ncbi:retrovirus-related Pol polyprotein from transposon 412 [Trichonephila clavipes]|nr:retrovirus-related Pol polyprotein from transposon 412 [Trichonephila clavipes]
MMDENNEMALSDSNEEKLEANKWYWDQTHDMPAMVGYLNHWATAAQEAIRAHNSVKWTQTLPTVLLGLRSALRSDTNYTNGLRTNYPITRVKKALEPPYDGPFPVAKIYDKYFTVKIKGKHINISVDRLKLAYLSLTDSDNLDHLKQSERAPTQPEKKTDCANKN